MPRPRVSAEREPTPRPTGTPRSFVCPGCDYVLYDGVDYVHCPTCGLAVDWVDLERPLWCCAGCDSFVNDHRDDWPRCAACNLLMDRVHALEQPLADERNGRTWGLEIAILVVGLAKLAQLVVLALDPVGFAFVAPIVVLLVAAAAALVLSLVLGGASEIAALARSRETRVIHGLEHACIAVAREAKLPMVAGTTGEGMFVVEAVNDGRASREAVQRAAGEAIRRVRDGESGLAYSRHCGTSLMVALLLVAIVIVTGTAMGLVVGLDKHVVMLGTALACGVAWLAARPLGLLAQRTLTVSTRFRDASVLAVHGTTTADGEHARFLVAVGVQLDGDAGVR